jgi:predicted enzyme related to lactoylglutathione lyase
MYWMDLSQGDVTFYRDLLGWEPGSGVFTVDGKVVAGHGAPGPPGWNLHAVVDDVAAVCGRVEELGGEVVLGSPAVATLADPTGAVFVVREEGPRAELLHKPMTFSWAELCTPDVGAAKSFYRALFGWDTVEVSMSMPSGPVDYTVFLAGTAEAAGLLPAEGAPCWLAYVEAVDADAVAADVVRLGGEVLAEPFDVPRIGRIAVLAGRSGETFAVMEMPGGG